MTAPRLREPRRPPSPPDRRSPRRGILAAALFAALAALVLSTTPARADVLVSNWDQNTSSDFNLSSSFTGGGQAFTTGTNANGYEISQIEVHLAVSHPEHINVSLWSANSSNFPGAQLFSLRKTSETGSGRKTFTARDNTLLSPGTTYIVTIVNEGQAGPFFDTISPPTALNDDPAEGWSIVGKYMRQSSGGSWTRTSNNLALRIEIEGKAITGRSPPPNLTARVVAPGRVTLEWERNLPSPSTIDRKVGYKIEGSESSGGPWTSLYTNQHVTDSDIWCACYPTRFNDDTITPGTTRYYRVSAISADGQSIPSDVVSATTPGLVDSDGGLIEFGAVVSELDALTDQKVFRIRLESGEYRFMIRGAAPKHRVVVTDGGGTEIENFVLESNDGLSPRITAQSAGEHQVKISHGGGFGNAGGGSLEAGWFQFTLLPVSEEPGTTLSLPDTPTVTATLNQYGDYDSWGVAVQPGEAYAVRVRGREDGRGTAATPGIRRANPPSTTHGYNMGKPWVPGVTTAAASTLCHNFAEPKKCEYQAFVIDLRGLTGAQQTWRISVAPTQRPDTRPYREGTYQVDLRQLSSSQLQGVPMPLRAWFASPPDQHDGSKAIKVRVGFSDAVDGSPEHGVKVEGGEVTSVRPVDGQAAGGAGTRSVGNRNAGQEDRGVVWEFEIEPDSDGDVTMSLEAWRPCDEPGAICTADGRSLAQGIATTVEGPEAGPPPLTARVARAPAEHNGLMAFTLRLAFSEPIRMSGRRLRAEVVAVAGGRVTKARPVKGRKDRWALRVKPASRADVTVTLAGGAACDTPAAVCTADGRALSHTLATTVPGPVALSVADTRAEEGTDETLDFAVSLSRPAGRPVRVAYATADGTARAGADYTRTRGTLRFAPGETVKTVRVPVLDDAHDEGEETLTLRLSKASRARLADRVATGTIKNSDRLQRAWLARFGRTVATHVTDAVGDRLRGTPGQESHLTVGGYRLPVGRRGATDGADDGVSGVERLVLALGQRLGLGTGPAPAGAGGVAGAGGWPDAPVATDPRLGQSRTLDVGNALNLRQVLLGSSFRLALGGDAVGSSSLRLTAWGRVAGTAFDGRDGKVSLDGDVLTGTVGVDGEWDRLLAGLAVAHSRGDGSYTMPVAGGDDSGNLEQTLTSIHPYLRYAVSDRLDVWGLFGYGWGELDLEMDDGMTIETDANLVMGAFGGRGILLSAAESGGFQLATRTDAMLTRTTSDKVAEMKSAEADAHRLRLVLEGSRGFTWAEGRSLTPTMEVGLRHDWGDAETGFGLELGGRVQYADPALGLTIDATVRGLLAHEDDDYQEWGASGTVRINPGATGQGLSLTLAPAWGAASSGVNGLWSRQTTAGLAPQGTRQTPAGRLNAEVGYGFTPFGTGLLTPYAGTVLSEGAARTYRVGGRLQLTGGWATGLTLSLEGQRQEPAGQQPVNQGLRLQVGWGF